MCETTQKPLGIPACPMRSRIIPEPFNHPGLDLTVASAN